MRAKFISLEVQEKRRKFENWIHSLDYISIPIKDAIDNEEKKANDRLKERDRKLKRV